MRIFLKCKILAVLLFCAVGAVDLAAAADAPIYLHCKPAAEPCVLHESLGGPGHEPTEREGNCAEAAVGQDLILVAESDVLIDASFQRTPRDFLRVKIGESADGSVKSAWTLRIDRVDGTYSGTYSSVVQQDGTIDKVQAQTKGICTEAHKT
jgi:hypothetical protein